MVVNATKMQESEAGDGTNFVISLAGELMTQAEQLIKMGLHPSDILTGYEKGTKKCLELLEGLVSYTVKDVHNREEIEKCIKSVVAAKQYGQEDVLVPLIAEASLFAMSTGSRGFNIENVRVAKILGSSMSESTVIHGMVITRSSETTIHHVKNAKVAVFNCPLETESGETKGTVLIKNAKDLMAYSNSEEEHMEKFMKELNDAGVNVVIAGGSVSDLALHFLQKYKMLVVKILSKFELRRIAKTLGATSLVRHGAPTAEEMGTADEVVVKEVGSQNVTIIRRNEEENRVATIVLRGSTSSLLDDAERAIDDAVNTIRSTVRDKRFLPGAGATEMILASEIQKFSKSEPGLDQYAVERFGQAFEVIPRTLSENAGFKAEEVIASLYAANKSGKNFGLDIETGKPEDTANLEIYDSFETKSWAIKLATDAVLTILKIDQIIVSKPAGGPANRQAQAPDME